MIINNNDSGSDHGGDDDTGILSFARFLSVCFDGRFVGGNNANNSQCEQKLLSSVSREVYVDESACSETSLLLRSSQFNR